MPNNYNKIAKYYDFIARLVYQGSLVKAQVFLVKNIPAKSSVLIVGGGTGWILEEIAKIHSTGLSITYLEISSEMIALAKKKDCKQNEVHFICGAVENYVDEKKYDIIFTAFLFDNFLPDKIKIVFGKLNEILKKDGVWLFADFVNDKRKNPLWQRVLLKTMYLFFRIFCNIEAQELIDMNDFFYDNYTKTNEAFFYAGFIRSIVYKRENEMIAVK